MIARTRTQILLLIPDDLLSEHGDEAIFATVKC